MTTAVTEEIAGAIAQAAPTLETAARGCKAGGFDPVGCAPQLYRSFSTSTATEMADAIVGVWACEASGAVVTQALTKCVVPTGGGRAFSDDEIAAAVAATLSLNWADYAMVGDRDHEIGLFQGDLTHMKVAEWVSLLVISCLPGDYSPTPGSMIAALGAVGVDVAQLAQNPTRDMRAQYGCWVSAPVGAEAFGQLLVLETAGADAPANIPKVFGALQTWLPTPPPDLTLASAMLSTGSGGVQPAAALTALFDGAKACMHGGYGLSSFKIVAFDQSWMPSLQALFDQLKAA